MWALYHISIRPDIITKHSSFQYIILKDQDIKYFNYNNSNNKNSFPLIYGIKTLLNNKNKFNKVLDALNRGPKSFPIDRNLATFIENNKSKLSSFEEGQERFFKASWPLQESEKISKYNYTKLKNITASAQEQSHMFNYTPAIKCSNDLNLYDNSLLLYNRKSFSKALAFAMKSKEGIILATIGTNNNNFKLDKTTGIFSGIKENYPSIPICVINKDSKNFALISLTEKDPGQLLYNLIKDDIQLSNSPVEIFNHLKKSRGLLLKNPLRYATENNNNLRSKHILNKQSPHVYKRNKIGKIWSIYQFDSNLGIIKDPRYPGHLSCK